MTHIGGLQKKREQKRKEVVIAPRFNAAQDTFVSWVAIMCRGMKKPCMRLKQADRAKA